MADTNSTKAKKVSFFGKIAKFFLEVKAELKKVSWPTREQLFHNTGIILVFIIIITIILSVLDVAFGKLFGVLTTLF